MKTAEFIDKYMGKTPKELGKEKWFELFEMMEIDLNEMLYASQNSGWVSDDALNILGELSEKRFEVIEVLRTDAVRWGDIIEVFRSHGIEFKAKEVPF